MDDISLEKRGVLYIITCAARSSEPMLVEDFVEQAQRERWIVHIIATPHAMKFINISHLEELTDSSVLSEYRHPDEPSETRPDPDAIVVFPATFNTMNKWALGIADTLALGVLCDYTGQGTPIVTVPCVPAFSLARHPAFAKSVALLREYGVHVVYDPDKYPPMNNVPGEELLRIVNVAIAERQNTPLQKEDTISR